MYTQAFREIRGVIQLVRGVKYLLTLEVSRIALIILVIYGIRFLVGIPIPLPVCMLVGDITVQKERQTLMAMKKIWFGIVVMEKPKWTMEAT